MAPRGQYLGRVDTRVFSVSAGGCLGVGGARFGSWVVLHPLSDPASPYRGLREVVWGSGLAPGQLPGQVAV